MVDGIKVGDTLWIADVFGRVERWFVTSVYPSGKRFKLKSDGGWTRTANAADIGTRCFTSEIDAAKVARRKLADNARRAVAILEGFDAAYPDAKEQPNE